MGVRRGNAFVVVAVVVTLPFLDRPIALPLLARLWHRSGPTKTTLAREMVELIAAAVPNRTMHVVGDSSYICTELRQLPPNVTLTGPLRSHAGFWHVHPCGERHGLVGDLDDRFQGIRDSE
jgi:hypothetical protein